MLTNIAVIEEQINKGKKIKNITAYLAKAFVVDFRKTETAYARKQEAKKIEKKELALKEEQKKEALEKLKETYHQERRERIETVLNELSLAEKETLKNEFIEGLLANETMKHIYYTKGFENIIIQGRWRDFIGGRFLASEYESFENYERSKSETH